MYSSAIGRLLGIDYRSTNNRPVPYWCISSSGDFTFMPGHKLCSTAAHCIVFSRLSAQWKTL